MDENSPYEKIYSYFHGVFVGVLTAATIVMSGYFNNSEWQNVDALFQTEYGTVFCGQIKQEACGVSLRKCGDDRYYKCMKNVFWDETKESRIK